MLRKANYIGLCYLKLGKYFHQTTGVYNENVRKELGLVLPALRSALSDHSGNCQATTRTPTTRTSPICLFDNEKKKALEGANFMFAHFAAVLVQSVT